MLSILISTNVCGCATLASGFVLGLLVSAGFMSRQDKSVGDMIDDVTIWASIKNKYFKHADRSIFRNVSVEVTEGRVLLTGGLKMQQARIEAVRMAWEVEGVAEVVDKITIIQNSLSLQAVARDTLISAQIRATLVIDRSIRSMNYTIDVFDGTVYLAGIARSREELKRVHKIVREVSGVQKVESYIRIKPPRVSEAPASGLMAEQELPAIEDDDLD